jgi:hypothetical protein
MKKMKPEKFLEIKISTYTIPIPTNVYRKHAVDISGLISRDRPLSGGRRLQRVLQYRWQAVSIQLITQRQADVQGTLLGNLWPNSAPFRD